MKSIALFLATGLLVAGALADPPQKSAPTDERSGPLSAKQIRGASPYVEIQNEAPPKLIVDDLLPDALKRGVVWIQWRVENVQIAPVFGRGALQASPRFGHLHIHVDDLPWWWADPSNINTIDLTGMPRARTRSGSFWSTPITNPSRGSPRQ